MIDAEGYLAEVEHQAGQLDREFVRYEGLARELCETSTVAVACVAFRQAVMTPGDTAEAMTLVKCGYMPDLPLDQQLAWSAFIGDIIKRSQHLDLERLCQRYTPEQPLFLGAPSLFSHIRRRSQTRAPDFELIDDKAVACVDRSEVYRVAGGFSKTSPHLSNEIANWARRQFPEAPRFLRLDPYQFYAEEPPRLLLKAAFVPADPHWMSRLTLFPNTKTYARYELQDGPLSDGRDPNIDYQLHGLRRIEMFAQRRAPDYLSMMIEELPQEDAANGLMVGRCIHLDTRAIAGTPIAQARLQHLDLAINVYTGEDRALRAADSLQEGKVRDATYRTHLYRIEDIPFAALFALAPMFLRSQVLVGEWLQGLGIESLAPTSP